MDIPNIVSVSSLLKGRSTLDQYGILMRADGNMPHVFSTTGYPHCVRCHVPLGTNEASWNHGTCPLFPHVGRYYGGILTPDEVLYLDPPKETRENPKHNR